MFKSLIPKTVHHKMLTQRLRLSERVLLLSDWKRNKGTGILMLNMGGPQNLEEVGPFLLRLFQDRDIIQLPFQEKLGSWIARRRTPAIRSKYSEIGGGSPILKWTNLQGESICRELDVISPATAPHKHYVGFRYAQPLTEITLEEMERDGVTRAVAFSQYPQYSCATSGSSMSAIYKFYKARGKTGIKWSLIDRWGTNASLVDTIVSRIQTQLEKFKGPGPVVILFSAHSLPMKAVNRGDPYPAEVGATVQLVMEKLNFSHPYRLVWQSKVGPVPWLQPSTEDAIKALAKKKLRNILLVPIAFTNEHIETLHELDIEYAEELGKEVGANVLRSESPNDHPIFIKGMAQMVSEHLRAIDRGEQNPVTPQILMSCPLCTRTSCRQTKQWLASLNTTK